MAKKKRKPARARRPPREVEELGPTPETKAHAAKQPPSVRGYLVENGLDAAGERACDEITLCYNAITHDVDSKVSQISAISHGRQEMADSTAEAITLRYAPWHQIVGQHTANLVKGAICRDEPLLDAIDDIRDAIMAYARLFR